MREAIFVIALLAFMIIPFSWAIVVFENRVKKDEKVDDEVAKRFKVNMFISGLLMALPAALIFLAMNDFNKNLLWILCLPLVSGGMLYLIAAKGIKRHKKEYSQNDG